jgi:NitT/TauT family transport system substrate-binding protein
MKIKMNRYSSEQLWLGGIGATCLIIALFVGIWAWSYSEQPATYTGPVEHIKTGYIGEYAALILMAEQQGYFKQHKLDVTLTQYASGPESLSALLAGKEDMAVASDFAGVSNSFKTNDLRLVATISKSEAFYMIGRKDHGISNAASLKGKKIGITQKTVGEFYVGQFLTLNNLSQSDVQIVSMTQAQLVDALAAGTVDAVALFQPNAYKAQQKLGAQAITQSIQESQSIYSSLFTTNKLITEHPQTIIRYVQALHDAEKYIAAHNTEARTAITKKLDYTDDYINSVWPHFTFGLSLDEELLLNMDDEARWSIENKLTPTTDIPNYLQFIYLDALEAVKPEAISVIR